MFGGFCVSLLRVVQFVHFIHDDVGRAGSVLYPSGIFEAMETVISSGMESKVETLLPEL